MTAQVVKESVDVQYERVLEDIKSKPSVPYKTKTPKGYVLYFLENPGTDAHKDAYKSISPW